MKIMNPRFDCVKCEKIDGMSGQNASLKRAIDTNWELGEDGMGRAGNPLSVVVC